MPDTVTSQTIINGARNLVMHFTNESDGTGETSVTKVDATSGTFGAPGIHLKIARITFGISGGSLRIRRDNSSDADAVILAGFGTFDYTFFGGLPDPNAAGATGSLLFTTVNFISGSSYDVTLEMIKAV